MASNEVGRVFAGYSDTKPVEAEVADPVSFNDGMTMLHCELDAILIQIQLAEAKHDQKAPSHYAQLENVYRRVAEMSALYPIYMDNFRFEFGHRRPDALETVGFDINTIDAMDRDTYSDCASTTVDMALQMLAEKPSLIVYMQIENLIQAFQASDKLRYDLNIALVEINEGISKNFPDLHQESLERRRKQHREVARHAGFQVPA